MIKLRHIFVRRMFIVTAAIAILFLSGLLLWQFHGLILTNAARLWAVSDRVDGQADAVIVLGGGVENRPQAAADLYGRGFAPKILVSNPKYSAAAKLGIEPSHAALTERILLKLGVPALAISSFGSDLRNTHDEARAVSAWAKATNAKRIIVPVEWYFSRRARWIFRRELAEAGVEVQIQRLDSIEPTPANWWRQEDGIVLLQNELLKYIYYRLKY